MCIETRYPLICGHTLKKNSKSSAAGTRSVTFSRAALIESCNFYHRDMSWFERDKLYAYNHVGKEWIFERIVRMPKSNRSVLVYVYAPSYDIKSSDRGPVI